MAKLFLFFGEEDYLIQERIGQLKKKIGDPALNIEQIDGAEPDIEKIVSSLRTTSLLGGDKLVIVRDADLSLEAWDRLVPFLKDAPETATLVFWTGKPARRSRIYKLIDELGEAIEFKPFADWEQDRVVSWITDQVEKKGKKIDPDAARCLQEICGNSLRKLDSEIEKLITYIGGSPAITLPDVRQLASPGEISAFALSDAVAERDLTAALVAFSVLRRSGEELFPLLGLLAANFRTMLQVKGGEDAGANPYFVRLCRQRARNFREEELRRGLELILETDLKLKSGGQAAVEIELLLAALCGK